MKFTRFAALQALVVVFSWSLFVAPVCAADDFSKLVTPSLIADTTAVVPGKPFRLGVLLKTLPGWHTYYKESGEAGMPTKVVWSLPAGWAVSKDLLWMKPHKFVDAGITTYGYANETLVGATVTPAADAKVGSTAEIKANVKWLACQDTCVPGKKDLTLSLKVVKNAEAANTQKFDGLGWEGAVKDLEVDKHADAANDTNPVASDTTTTKSAAGNAAGGAPGKFSGSILDADIKVADSGEKKLSLPLYLGLAFVGGFILNFMPCVLPVISIKVLSFMQQAGDDPKRVFRLGLAFTAGIVSAFLALACGVIAVQAAGQKIGWGFQFQYPVFLFAMAAVVLLFALSLFGLFYIQVSAGQDSIDKLASKEGYTGTFFKGVLATTLSTPCSAPFLGTALGFAFSEPPHVVLLMFATIAAGMAFPYILLTAKPAWMKYLPKPGVWMEKFKESMGFLLLATVVWLVWVLGQQVGINAAMAAVAFLVALSFAAWLVGRFTDLTSTGKRRATIYALAAVILVGAYAVIIRPFPELLAFASPAPQVSATTVQVASATDSSGIKWQPFSIDRLNAELAAGKTVFVDFTADWCLTCKVNENTVLNTKPVIDKFSEIHAVTLRADWTKQDATIASLLHKFGRSGVPLYVVFPASRPTQPIVLPETITVDLVLQKLDEASK